MYKQLNQGDNQILLESHLRFILFKNLAYLNDFNNYSIILQNNISIKKYKNSS